MRARLLEMAREEGLEVTPEDITVTLEPLDPGNLTKLATYESAAIGIAGKLKNHELDAMFLGMRVTVRAKWGPVARASTLERNTWVHKSLVGP